MVMMSSSTPILNSCLHYSRNSILSSSLISISAASSFQSASLFDDCASKKVVSGSLVRTPPRHSSNCKKQQCRTEIMDEKEEEDEAKPRSRIQRLLSNSGLSDIAADESEKELQTLVEGGGIGGGSGGGGRRSDGAAGTDGSEFDSSTDAYYEKMISGDPGNSLLLGNYAKFLKEVRRDYGKAEEYYGRAILENPEDGNILSLYADLIWEKDKDSQRAENYFNQAVHTAPQDSYVVASYASFLWDAEEDDDDGDDDIGKNEPKSLSPPTLINARPLAVPF